MASFRFHRTAPVASEVRRIAAGQAKRALRELEDEEPHEAVHQVRRRCKKVRALLRLVRGSAAGLYARENAAFRDTARRISGLRDATGWLEAFDMMASRHPGTVDTDRFAPVRAGLVARRDALAEEHLDESIAAVADDLTAARERIEGWDLPVDGFDALADGLAKTYGRARDGVAAAAADRTVEVFHEWRKRVKYHRYHVRLLQNCWRGPMKARRDQLHELSDLLGDDHDLAGLDARLREDPDQYGGADVVGELLALLDHRRAWLQLQALALGKRCFVESPKRHVARMRGYWDVWQHEPTGEELLPPSALADHAPAGV